MDIYINGIGAISPQNNDSLEDLIANQVFVGSGDVRCKEPDYKAFLSPAVARRMSRMVKFSIAAALKALKEAEVENPDAILTGTSMGCLQDTEKFLNAIIDNDEQFLTPTSFIQSTHNTVGAQIALFLKCFQYNFTYVQRGLSFETALLDSLMLIKEGEGKHVLVGGHDEMTKGFYTLYDRINYWKKEAVSSLLENKTNGVISGEGASFFVLSNEKKESTYAKVKEVKTIHKPANEKALKQKIVGFIEENGPVDLILYGINGDTHFDLVFDALMENELHAICAGYFKHLCGEYGTSTSYAMFLASMMLQEQKVPQELLISNEAPKKLQNILIVNGYRDQDFSLILLEHAK